jgi:SpoVK/Ycf46/Vps4 family AAA+-type ATPase
MNDDLDLILDEPSSCRSEPESEPTGPRHLTGSQAAALRQLSDLAALRGQPGRGGISLRNKPLLIGPSGSGKTAVVRRVCDLEKLPLLVVNAGSWIVRGALTAGSTLSTIVRFVRQHPEGCVLIDEIDKSCPSGATMFSQSWALSVFTEIISLLDCEGKLQTCGWDTADIRRLNQSYVIIGAGAWQAHSVAARKDSPEDGAGCYASKVVAEAGIPEEILYRFNARLIELTAPGRKDISMAINRVRSELALPALASVDQERLVENAARSNVGIRWIEQYLADLLIQNPRAREKIEAVPAKKSDRLKLSRGGI